MKCEVCGEECSQGDLYCKNCGTHLGETSLKDSERSLSSENADGKLTTKAKKKKALVWSISITSIILVIVLLFTFVVVPALNTPKQEKVDAPIETNQENPNSMKGIYYFTLKTNLNTKKIVFSTSKGNAVQIENAKDFLGDMVQSLDGKTAAFIIPNQTAAPTPVPTIAPGNTRPPFSYSGSISKGTLYAITGNELVQISSDVENALISLDGSSIAYIVCQGSDAQKNELHYYNIAERQDEKVESNVYVYEYYLSPNGKILSYSTLQNTPDSFTCYIKMQGQTAQAIGQDIKYIAFNNDLSIIYYLKAINSEEIGFFVKSNGKEYLLSNFNMYGFFPRCVYNEDNTQVLFNKNDGVYISRNGGEGVKVFDNNFSSIVLPKYDKKITNFTAQNANISYLPYKNLSKFAYIDSEGKMIYVNSKLKGNYFGENAQSSSIYDLYKRCYLSENGSSVLYIDKENNLCKAETNKPIGNAKVLLKSVAKFSASEDNQLIYALTQKNELYCIKDDSEPIEIAHRINSDIVMSNDNKTAFYTIGVSENTAGGTLYASHNGGEGKVIQTSGGVIGLVATPANVFFYNYEYIDGKTEISIYKSNGDTNFTKFSQ